MPGGAREAAPPVAPSSAAVHFFVGDYAFVGTEHYDPHDMERRDVFDYIKRSRRVKNDVQSGPAVAPVSWRHSLKSHFIRDSATVIQDAEGKTADLRMYNSFQQGDLPACGAVVRGRADENAEHIVERACELLFMALIVKNATANDPSAMILRTADWKVPIKELLAQVAVFENFPEETKGTRQAIPQPYRGNRASQYVPPESEAEREEELLQMLKELGKNVSRSGDWVLLFSCRPLWRLLRRPIGAFAKLCMPGALLSFLLKHKDEFEVKFNEEGKFMGAYRLKLNETAQHGPSVASSSDGGLGNKLPEGTQQTNPGEQENPPFVGAVPCHTPLPVVLEHIEWVPGPLEISKAPPPGISHPATANPTQLQPPIRAPPKRAPPPPPAQNPTLPLVAQYACQVRQAPSSVSNAQPECPTTIVSESNDSPVPSVTPLQQCGKERCDWQRSSWDGPLPMTPCDRCGLPFRRVYECHFCGAGVCRAPSGSCSWDSDVSENINHGFPDRRWRLVGVHVCADCVPCLCDVLGPISSADNPDIVSDQVPNAEIDNPVSASTAMDVVVDPPVDSELTMTSNAMSTLPLIFYQSLFFR